MGCSSWCDEGNLVADTGTRRVCHVRTIVAEPRNGATAHRSGSCILDALGPRRLTSRLRLRSGVIWHRSTFDPRSPAPLAHETGRSGPGRVLVVEGLCREYGTRRVVDNFDLSLSAGERVALRGRNGSGKTTILRCILGTLTPTSGRILDRWTRSGLARCPRPGRRAAAAGPRLLPSSHRAEESALLRQDPRSDRHEASRRVDELDAELGLAEILSRRLDRCSTGCSRSSRSRVG